MQVTVTWSELTTHEQSFQVEDDFPASSGSAVVALIVERGDAATASVVTTGPTVLTVEVAQEEPIATTGTWTFCGHWKNDRIVVEYYVPGDVQDQRVDTGFWDEGLWAAAGSGATVEDAMADTIAEYEGDLHREDES